MDVKVVEYLDHLVGECSKLMQETSPSDKHGILKSLYRIIKKGSIQNLNSSSIKDKEQETIFSLIKSLLYVLLDDNISSDALLLCGTCLALLVASLFKPEFASSFLMHTYFNFEEKYSGKEIISEDSRELLKKEVVKEIKTFFFNSESYTIVKFKLCKNYVDHTNNFTSLKTPSFQQIAILNGIVSCQIYELYSFQLSFIQNKPFLIFVFNAIHQCCLSPSVHQYHAFIVLLNWMRMCEMLIYKFQENKETFFSLTSEIVQKLLNLLECNWQSPIKGINGFIKELYKGIIKLNKMESKNRNLSMNDTQLIPYLLDKTMVLSWNIKGKYFLLSVILQNIDYSEFLQKHPDVPTEIIFSLKANYISSSVAEVYKVIITNMKKCSTGLQLSLEWCKWWRDPILSSLKCDDRLLIQNVTNNVLSWTMRQFPKSYELMMEAVSDSNNDSVKLLLLRVAKENFSCSLGVKELNLIDKNLHHHNIQTRSEVLSILCSSPKKSEPVKSTELKYIEVFVLENLNIDSAPFHQYLLCQLHTLLIRIRDSLAQEFRSKIQKNEHSIDLSQLKFVDWLTYTAIKNTFPGACFQRRRLCLQLLNTIYGVFIESPMGYKRKENPSKSVEQMIKWAQVNNLLLFFNNNILTYILPCITDFADEIRILCANLLCTYSSWPALDDYDTVNNAAETEYALTLCNHPDYRNNDGGAHMCCIIFNRLYHWSETNESPQALNFLKYLLCVSKHQLETAKKDFLSAALSKPIHGILLALQYCLTNSKRFFIKLYEYQRTEVLDFLKDSVHMCFDIVDYMLRIMKGENGNYYCPSFSDIGKAMEKLVLAKKNSLSNSTLDDSALVIDEFENYENSEYTTLCDLLLSCCWHSIKNSCFLLCEISSLVLAISIDNMEKKNFLMEIAEEFSSILIACRHRGVVEACCGALNTFCVNLLKDKILYEDITMSLLKKVFENLNDSSMASVTRRSAGLPLLFQAVVSSEENCINPQLLSYTIKNLLNLINKPLPSPVSVSEKMDLPQAHAYHILKALVSDARLSQSILPYFDSVIPVCIVGFSSTLWAIRNGALQLFGVILPRVCGQKKVRDDDSEHNMVSAFELFARCPSLKYYLHQELTKCVKCHHERKLCSELVPILSLLVKLMPEREDQRIFMIDFTPLLLELLDIPVWKVRDLVSSALSLLMHSSEIINLLKEVLQIVLNENINANKVHSLFLIVHNFMKRNPKNILSNVSFIEEHLKNLYILIQEKLSCPLLLGVILDMLLLVSKAKNDVSLLVFADKAESAASSKNEIGFIFYESKSVLSTLKISTLQSLPVYVKKISSKNKEIKIVCLQFLSEKLHSEKATGQFYTEKNKNQWEDIFVSILEYIAPEEHPSVITEALKFMINLSNDVVTEKAILDSVNSSIMENLKCHLDADSGLSVSAYAFTMWSICIRYVLKKKVPDQRVNEHVRTWNLLFSTYCQPRSNDILRLQGAISLAILGPLLFKYLTSYMEKESGDFTEIFMNICEGSILLLQDEDEDIRNEACKFPSQIPHNYQAEVLQFNVGIQVLFQYMLQVLHSEPIYMLYLWNRLQNYPSTEKILQSYSTVKKRNLFEQEYVNVFSEPHQILILHQNNLKDVLSNLSKKNYELYFENILMFLHDVEVEIEDVSSVLSLIKFDCSNQNFIYHHQAYLSLKKLKCQVEIISDQMHSILADDLIQDRLIKLKEKWTTIEKFLPSAICWFLNVL